MGIYPWHTVLYAVILDPKRLREVRKLSNLVPDNIKIMNTGELHFLVIKELSSEELVGTQYYQTNKKKWNSTRESIEKITSTEIIKKTYSELFNEYGELIEEEKTYSDDPELKKFLEEFVMTKEEHESLSQILDSKLSEFIIDHGWCDFYGMDCSYDEHIDLVRSLEYLIELDVKIERGGEYEKKLSKIGSYPWEYRYFSGKTYVKFLQLHDNDRDKGKLLRFTNSKYYRDNRIGWKYCDPHRIKQYEGYAQHEYGRIRIEDHNACEFTPEELKNLELIKEAFGDHYVGASWYDNMFEYNKINKFFPIF